MPILAPSKRHILLLMALPALFYFHHLSHWPIPYRVTLIVPVLILNTLFGFFLQKQIHRRLTSTRPPYKELTLSIGLFGIILFAFPGKTTAILLVILFIWLLFQIHLKKNGHFYAAFAGIAIFSVVLCSYALLYMEESLLFQRYNRWQMAEVRWEEVEKRRFVLHYEHQTLTLELPSGLYPHKNLPPPFFLPGHHSGRLSASMLEGDTAPFISIHLLPIGTFHQPTDFQRELEQGLITWINQGKIKNIQLKGTKTIQIQSKQTLHGLVFQFTELASNRLMEAGLYVTPRIGEQQFAFLFHSPRPTGFPHHPDILQFFQKLQLSSP